MSIPRVRRGEIVTAEMLNRIIDAVNAARVVVDPGTLEATHTRQGIALRAATRDDVVRDFKATSTITKRSGATLGSGTATMQSISAAGAYVDTGVSVTVYSKWTDKQVNSGAYITCVRVGGTWEVIDVDDCANLS